MIVELFGGRISVQSELNEGSTFTFTFEMIAINEYPQGIINDLSMSS
jgi:signal transduction histidine kinase